MTGGAIPGNNGKNDKPLKIKTLFYFQPWFRKFIPVVHHFTTRSCYAGWRQE
jgi:hypothetical protein